MQKDASTKRSVISLDPAKKLILDMRGMLTSSKIIELLDRLEDCSFEVSELDLGFNPLNGISMIRLSLNLVSNTILTVLNLEGTRFPADKLDSLRVSISCGGGLKN